MAGRRMAVVVPLTDDARSYQGRYAGIASRCAANVIDFLVAVVILGGGYVGFATLRFIWHPRSFTFPTPPSLPFVIVAGSIVAALYYSLAWMTTGRTYGDFVLGLRVVGRSGGRLGPGMAVLRAIACVVWPIGLLWVAVSWSNRSLQDLLLRTRVVYDWVDAVPQRSHLRVPGQRSSQVGDVPSVEQRGRSQDERWTGTNPTS